MPNMRGASPVGRDEGGHSYAALIAGRGRAESSNIMGNGQQITNDKARALRSITMTGHKIAKHDTHDAISVE